MDAVKAEKEIARRRFHRLRQIGHLLRCIEAALFLLFLSYSSTRIPVAARTSGIFFHRATAFLISPRFVFLLGNAIVLVLLKSGHFSHGSVGTGTAISELPHEISYPPTLNYGAPLEGTTICVPDRPCRRTRSEKLERRREEVKLRRAETQCFKNAGMRLSEAARDTVCAVEEDDADQFRRTVEEFIAKQQQFRRAESLAVVASSVDPVEAVP